jgi:hypothetical protein
MFRIKDLSHVRSYFKIPHLLKQYSILRPQCELDEWDGNLYQITTF